MFTFFVQLQQLVEENRIHLFLAFYLYVLLRWGVISLSARFYKSFTAEHKEGVSVIIPVVDEEENFFREVLNRICREIDNHTADGTFAEVIVVINGPRNTKLEAVCQEFPLIRWSWTEKPSKRNALMMGILRARGNISVLVDSDCLWTGKTLVELMKPFADPEVGGVTTHQEIYYPQRHDKLLQDTGIFPTYHPHRNLLTRFAAWMEDIRSYGSFPALSVFGQVGCLPGRTIAIRTSICRDSLPAFMNQKFLGVRIEFSDDRQLTHQTLLRGFKTVYQRSSVVLTDAPSQWGKFVKQQLRWARGSQLTTLQTGRFLIRKPLLAFVFFTDTLTPFFLVGVLVNAVANTITHSGTVLFPGTHLATLYFQVPLAFCGAILGIGLRQVGHFTRYPRDVFLLPLFVITLTIVMVPIRIWGLMTCADHTSWGTRIGAYMKEGKGLDEKKTPIPLGASVSHVGDRDGTSD